MLIILAVQELSVKASTYIMVAGKKIIYFSYFLLLNTLKCRYYVRNDDHSGDYLYAVEQKRIHSATACYTSATAFTVQARRYQTTRY